MEKTTRLGCGTALACVALALSPATQAGERHDNHDYAQREAVRQFAHELAERENLDEGAILGSLGHAQYLPSVIKAILPPASPTTKSWQRYRSRYLEPVRLKSGAAFWKDNAATLARAEAEFGVPQEMIVAIIGVETLYGRDMGRYQTLSALTTLAFDYPPRAELFRRELGELFILARDQKIPVERYQGSYAGALGLPQFLPSSVRRFAVDYDGNGQIDLSGSATDAIGSVASFFHNHGWIAGGPVAVPAKVADPQRALALIEAGIEPKFLPDELAKFGVTADTPEAPAQAATLIALVTPGAATEYWLGYNNFYVITRYNRSSFYAMAVYQLATALALEHKALAGDQDKPAKNVK